MQLRTRTFITLMCLVMAFPVFARDQGRFGDRGDFVGKEVIERLTRTLHRLDLSEEQRAGVRENIHGLRLEVAPLVKELQASRMALLEQVGADEYDADAVAEIAANQGALTTEITMHVSDAISGVLSTLTDEQRAELRAMREERMGRRMEMRDKARAERRSRREARSGDDANDS